MFSLALSVLDIPASISRIVCRRGVSIASPDPFHVLNYVVIAARFVLVSHLFPLPKHKNRLRVSRGYRETSGFVMDTGKFTFAGS